MKHSLVLAVVAVSVLEACRREGPAEDAPVDAAPTLDSREEARRSSERAHLEREALVALRSRFQPRFSSCPPMKEAQVAATLARTDRSIRGASFECVGVTPAGVLWSAERRTSYGDCNERQGTVRHWLVLLSPEPRIVEEGEAIDGGCPCAMPQFTFEALFFRRGELIRTSADADGGVSYRRLAPEGFVADPALTLELEADDAREAALDVVASAGPDSDRADPELVRARTHLGW